MPVILITGGGSGFGLAAGRELAQCGQTVVATVRGGQTLQDVPFDTVQLELDHPASREAAVRRVLERHGQIDVLINNAGVFSFGPAEALGEQDLRKLFETNVFAAFAMMALVLPEMRARRSGRIVNVTSVAAFGVRPFMSGYCATKHALDALSSGMDRELRPFGVCVTSVAPVAFKTRIVRGRPDSSTPYGAEPQRSFEDFQERMGRRTDLTPVVDAIVEAATATDPKPRYVVAPGETAFDAVVAAKEQLEGGRAATARE